MSQRSPIRTTAADQARARGARPCPSRSAMPSGESSRWLDLRVSGSRPSGHSNNPLMLKLGGHPEVVSKRLGRASNNITLDTYSHVLSGIQHAAAETFDKALAGTTNANGRVDKLEVADCQRLTIRHYGKKRGASRKPRNAFIVGRRVVGRQGFEPWTLGLKVRCSDQTELPALGTVVPGVLEE